MEPDAPTRAATRGWWAVAAVSVANVVVALDFFGVDVALPSIGREVHASASGLQWIANGYLLALAAPLLAAGRFGDLLGRRRVALGGLALFAAGSVMCALAPTTAWLVGGRALAGLGAAAVTATALAIVSAAFPGTRRAVAIGVWSAIGAAGAAVGPLLGGVVTDALSWRWLFAISAALAVLTAMLVRGTVTESRDPSTPAIDVRGAVLVTGGLLAAVVALVEAPDRGWSAAPVAVALVAALVLLVAFARQERRAAAPLLSLSLFRSRAYAATAAVALVANIAFGAAMFFLTLYLQEVRGLDARAAGLAFLALTVPLMASSPIVGALVVRLGARALMVVGMAVLAGSFAAFATIDAGSGIEVALAGLAVSGIGQAFAFNVSNIAAMDAAPDRFAGAASGAISAIRQVGALLGTAATAAVFRAVSPDALRATGHFDAALRADFLDGFRLTMLVTGLLCAVTIAAPATLGVSRRGPDPSVGSRSVP